MKRLGRIKRISGLRRLPGLSGRSKRHKKPKLPSVTLPAESSGPDTTEQNIARLYGDSRLAARVRKLLEEYPDGSIPELVVLDWLRWKGISFKYQVQLYGGWSRAGGLIPDFLLTGSNAGKVIQVQGDYWHGRSDKKSADMDARLKLIGSVWNGIRIITVTNVWEGDLRDSSTRQRTLNLAIAGMETGS